MNLKEHIQGFENGVKAAFETKRKAAATVLISFLSFILIALSSLIGYSIQMFSAGLRYWIPAIELTTRGLYLEGGWVELGTTILYATLIGITITNFYIQLKNHNFRTRNLSGIAPGFLVAGCAGCGIGILGALGLAGGLAVLPFQGELIRILGIGLLIYFIIQAGNSETCPIPSS